MVGSPMSMAHGERALIRNNSVGANLYTAAHEIGHLARFEHSEEAGGEGYNVRTKTDKRYSVDNDTKDFMTWEPVQSAQKILWINDWHYQTLGLWTGAWLQEAAGQQTADSRAFSPLIPSADPLLQVSGAISETTGTVTLLPWYQMEPGEYEAPASGPYNLVFVDSLGQQIPGYTRSFGVGGTLQPAQPARPDRFSKPVRSELAVPDAAPAFFTFVTPYPATMAKVQIRRIADNALLKEVTASASAPALNIDPPGGSPWQGPKTITWQSDPGTRYFALDVSTDNGTNWEALAIHLTGKRYTIQTDRADQHHPSLGAGFRQRWAAHDNHQRRPVHHR